MSRRRWYRDVYLRSAHWQRVRMRAYAELGSRCCVCGSIQCLQVHHLNYRHLWHEVPGKDVVIVCDRHHRRITARGLFAQGRLSRAVRVWMFG